MDLRIDFALEDARTRHREISHAVAQLFFGLDRQLRDFVCSHLFFTLAGGLGVGFRRFDRRVALLFSLRDDVSRLGLGLRDELVDFFLRDGERGFAFSASARPSAIWRRRPSTASASGGSTNL